ncbi:MAG: DNA repair protein RadA [Caedimonas sp.]|nr:DNA repair protein RadA [Caedimonas sp.]
MTKERSFFVCQQCGITQPKWSGKCPGCDSWNSLTEETLTQSPFVKSSKQRRASHVTFETLDEQTPEAPRFFSGVTEFDRVCGGGIVPGSVLLVGGDPGIGKSTLLLQVAARLSQERPCYYISGEEAVEQVRARAIRLGVTNSSLKLASATQIQDIIAALETKATPLVIIDSIQTMYLEGLDSVPGSVSQVRASTHELIRLAKKSQMSIIMVGHVTKEGVIAGPRVLEHMVDTVLYFEGERGHQFRILRAVKNRFGPTDEIGVFEMTQQGLMEVPNPSALFLSERHQHVSGSAVFAGIEGTRPVLVEIQALVAQSSPGTPRRAVIGWDSGRLAMVLAVLETRCGIQFTQRDIYLNVAGGLRIVEPAADLAVSAALVSALYNVPLPSDAIFCGEIGLSGEVRSIGQMEPRLKEAAKLGFKKAYIPEKRGAKSIGDLVDFPFILKEKNFLGDMITDFLPEDHAPLREASYA